MEQAPRPLSDPAPGIEARDHGGREVEGELADPHPDRLVRRGERNGELREREVDRPVEPEEGAVDAGETEAERGQVLVERERDRPMGDGVEDLRRQQQPIDDRPGEGQVREEAGEALEGTRRGWRRRPR